GSRDDTPFGRHRKKIQRSKYKVLVHGSWPSLPSWPRLALGFCTLYFPPVLLLRWFLRQRLARQSRRLHRHADRLVAVPPRTVERQDDAPVVLATREVGVDTGQIRKDQQLHAGLLVRIGRAPPVPDRVGGLQRLGAGVPRSERHLEAI